MHTERLNEHDAHEGAQSKGEFFGMTGNSAWYLFGAAGVSVLLVIGLWGVLGFPLLLCLGFGVALCLLSLAYVFVLKNNRPEHYDTDFFESALVEAGVLRLAFGPGERRPPNPFRSATLATPSEPTAQRGGPASTRVRPATVPTQCRNVMPAAMRAAERPQWENEEAPMVPLAAYERLRTELNEAEDILEDALAGREEGGVCE